MAHVAEEIQPPIWNVLLQSIHDGRCVPFLGAGANLGGGGMKIPTGAELAMEIVCSMSGTNVQTLEELVTVEAKHDVLKTRKELVRLDLSDLARISMYYRDQLGAKDFVDDIRARIIKASEPAPLLKFLARLPFELIVTTNYDLMMERALGSRPYFPIVQPTRGFDEKKGADLNEQITNFNGVRLYKLHGEFPQPPAAGEPEGRPPTDGEVSPIIITEEDYITFLTILRDPLRGVPKWIGSQIRQSRFLFLGYGLEDWDFRTLFEGLIAPIPKYLKPKSYAIQWEPPAFWVKYWAGREIDIYGMDIKVFARQLEERYVAKFGEPDPVGG